MHNNDFLASSRVYLTSCDGIKLEEIENIYFNNQLEKSKTIEIFPKEKKQKIVGIGGAFTESSAFVLAHLDKEKRDSVMKSLFSKEGANYSLTRTVIGSCDFSVNGKYSYSPIKNDLKLEYFSLNVDKDGFNAEKYINIKDEKFDLLPMIKEAQKIKNKQRDKDLRILASAWTAPPWMKDNQEWYGGKLLSQYESVYADYLIKYLESYAKEGIDIWGITPVNEPFGNDSSWESLHFTPESQNEFIGKYFGPKLKEAKYDKVKLLINDHNRVELEKWTDTIYGDKKSSQYVYGAAIHWYESTFKVYEDILLNVHNKYPEYSIIHTEGCIDNLGNDAPQGVLDKEGYKESGWFDNDSFWWNENATDWAYTATWPGVIIEDHPKYTPIHRYARDIIVSFNNWVSGWIDWNMVLDKRGGPNHVGNFCGAPIMIDTQTQYVYYTPIYYILAQFSRTIRPGNYIVHTIMDEDITQNGIYSCASINEDGLLSVQILNTNNQAFENVFKLCIENQMAFLNIPANSLQTIQIPLGLISKNKFK